MGLSIRSLLGTHRAVYRLLLVLQIVVGLWRKAGSSNVSSSQLCRFAWTLNSIQGDVFEDDSMHTPARRSPWLTLSSDGTAFPATPATKCSGSVVLRDYATTRDNLFSRAAEAAAAVACSGTRHQVFSRQRTFPGPVAVIAPWRSACKEILSADSY